MATEPRCVWFAIKKEPWLVGLQHDLDLSLKANPRDEARLDMLNQLIKELTVIGFRAPRVPPYNTSVMSTQAVVPSPKTMFVYGNVTGWNCFQSPMFIGQDCDEQAKMWLADPKNYWFMEIVKRADLHILVGCGDGPHA